MNKFLGFEIVMFQKRTGTTISQGLLILFKSECIYCDGIQLWRIRISFL